MRRLLDTIAPLTVIAAFFSGVLFTTLAAIGHTSPLHLIWAIPCASLLPLCVLLADGSVQ